MESCLSKTYASATSGSSASIFSQLIQTLLIAQCSFKNQQSYPTDRREEILKNDLEFDFIVVGGGTAGSAVASRLSEISDWRILLIERGDDPSWISDIPAFMSDLVATKESYNYKVEPDVRFCQGMKNQQCNWPKGKALGGSSVINAMLHIYGNDRDFDQWAKLTSEDWSYENVLPYFRKAGNYHPNILAKYGHKFFGTGGPLTIRSYNYSITEMHNIVINATKELGIPIIEMVNTDQYIGIGKTYGTIENGVRQNVAKAYLGLAKNRDNLYIMKSTKVNSIKLNGKRATGVEAILNDGQQVIFKASKEVILSAGSIATPHILMLSGIGPRNDLKLHNIEVIADLPVGKNLQDHIIWPGIFFTFVNETSLPISTELVFDWAYKYLMYRTGEFNSISGIDLTGFLNTKNATAKYPNVQFLFSHISRNNSFLINGLSNSFHFREELVEKLRELNQKYDFIIPYPILLNPVSKGLLTLRSSNPDDQIKIHANYFDSKKDIEIFLEVIDVLRSFINTTTFKKLDIQLRSVDIPECTNHAIESQDYWKCNLRYTATTVFHPVGTCKMGLAVNNDSVVNPYLKVHNIKGLRVIDASVMPIITSGNTNAPTLMIAEKGSDLIKKDWLVKEEL